MGIDLKGSKDYVGYLDHGGLNRSIVSMPNSINLLRYSRRHRELHVYLVE